VPYYSTTGDDSAFLSGDFEAFLFGNVPTVGGSLIPMFPGFITILWANIHQHHHPFKCFYLTNINFASGDPS